MNLTVVTTGGDLTAGVGLLDPPRRRRGGGAERRMTVLLRPDFPSLATRAIVARELSCTDRHIDRLIAAGRLQRVKLGSRVLITRDSVQALIDSLPAA